jgi:hypothetical protein
MAQAELQLEPHLKLIIIEAQAELNFSSSLGLERLFVLLTKVNFFPLEEGKKTSSHCCY